MDIRIQLIEDGVKIWKTFLETLFTHNPSGKMESS